MMRGDLREPGGLAGVVEASPAGVSVRSRVHEYGGGEYDVWRDRLFFVDDADGRVYGGRVAGASAPLTPPGSRYADLVCSPDGCWLLAVEERPQGPTEPENRLVAIALRPGQGAAGVEAGAEPRVVAAGHDFYSSAVFSPGSDRIAFLSWDHPNMPWNGSVLEVVDWSRAGSRGEPRPVAGGSTESLFQPRFAADGSLFVVGDRSGWWNLARVTAAGLEPVHAMAAEFGRAQWVLGLSSWAFIDDGARVGCPAQAVLASATRDGRDELGRLDLRDGSWEELPTAFCQIQGIEVEDGWASCLAGSRTRASGLYVWRVDGGAPQCVRESASLEISDATISVGQARDFSCPDGRTTHAFVYSPRSQTQRAAAGERPPLLVKSHGGPTAATSVALDPRIQFWTSRGFAVVDVNYGGSTGYGRAYRDLLEESWGLVDVEDCVGVARALAAEGFVDGDRLAISGGSAGGFTTLCALTFHDAFSAGASHYGIGDLEALARDTHKFESHYTDWLVGPLPDARDRYLERSPIRHADRLACPAIFFQGLEDRVVLPSQAEAMVAVLAERGLAHAYVAFEGEQHGFRRAENIRTALDGELYFYSRVFGFDAPRPQAVRVVGGRVA